MSYQKLKQGEAIPFNESLTIQLIQGSDLQDIIEMLNDDKVNQYLFFAPADNSLYEGFFGPIIKNTAQAIKDGVWPDSPTFVIRDQQGQYMGMCAVTAVMFLNGNYEVGYQLPTCAWGKGVATRACQMMTEIGFTELNAHKVSADCYASNAGSYKTLEKNGFTQEGRQKDYYKLEQGFDNKLYYGITAEQFASLNR
ncbi:MULTISPECIES: GNAT family N-acetyltransferase [Vibrio]|uniref:GNAT family N-acetyltransferase n=1 Tax=Vibrio TaxID=662 RepID=UPI001BD5989A|nr:MULTISPECIES: GNAT family protein [Vibrio]ELA9458494.1 GNAT family N-acetyltransferase [Vibrio alginolyticus]MBS9844215.1 GNAT family N-acetyltransferase [Vibrio alginolyticus]MCG9742626.1 GNAT family N-acetyltransferase [Vibrio alginolyticus]MDW1634215.1 GNAT family protein [Vibrio sp. Vb2907]MDW1705066.1 GNAT family protein [Vibrio sp. Vb2917]